MKKQSHSSLITLATLLLLVTTNAYTAGQGDTGPKAELIAITYDGFGMLSPQGRYLYFRVCEDGTLQYEVESSTLGVKEMRTGHLTASQFSSLRKLLDSKEIKALQGTYDTKSTFRDYRLTLGVRVLRAQGEQKFEVLNLLSETKESFPRPILQLFCAIDKLREADFKMSRECS